MRVAISIDSMYAIRHDRSSDRVVPDGNSDSVGAGGPMVGGIDIVVRSIYDLI